MNKSHWIALVVAIVLVIYWVFAVGSDEVTKVAEINDFISCVEAGNPVMESYPRQCNHEGKHFVEEIGNVLEKMDLIRLESPRPGEAIESPLVIRGQARGYWFFEATFPVALTDWDGKIIAEHYAEASPPAGGDPNDPESTWMTEDFVPFEATMEFTKPSYGERGTLILKKDNPSGLPERDDALEIPILF